MNVLHLKRFGELLEQLEKVRATKFSEYSPLTQRSMAQVDADVFLNWRVKVHSLLVAACGSESVHVAALKSADAGKGTTAARLEAMAAVFMAAKEDYEGGYLSTAAHLVQADVFDSELEQARELHRAGYWVPAAVVAGVVLETTIRAMCDERSLPLGTLDAMNASLAKAEAYNKLRQKEVTFLADIRNKAAHGMGDQLKPEDVGAMIEAVRRFVADVLA